MRKLGARVLVTLLVLACGRTPAPPASSQPVGVTANTTGRCSLDGTVASADGAPVDGALVTALVPYGSPAGASARTDPAGLFCIGELREGDYAISVTSLVGSAYLEPRGTRDRGHAIAVRLEPPGFVLRGLVDDERGPLARVHLRLSRRLTDISGQIFVVETDALGHFAVNLPAAAYGGEVETEDAAGAMDAILLDRDKEVRIAAQPRNPAGRAPPPVVLAWAKEHAIPLRSVEPGNGFDDLEPLRSIIGDARLVAFGEATHGTHEFRAFATRLLEFLVTQMAFRAAIVEESFAETLADDAYVRSSLPEEPGRGPLIQLVHQLNQGRAATEKVRFLGNDLRRPARGISVLAKAVPRLDAPLWRAVQHDLEPLADDWSTFIDVHFGAPPSSREDATLAAAERVARRLDERRAGDIEALGDEAWALARVHAHVVADFARLMKSRSFEARERSMAENTVRLLDVVHPKGRAVLFAHNMHVQKVAQAGVAQGVLLQERLGDDYVVIGSAFDQGAMNAHGPRGWGVVRVGPAPRGSFDGLLAAVGLPLLALDLRGASAVAHRWLDTPTLARSIGAVYDDARPEVFFDGAPPAARFDAVIFVANSTPLEPEASAAGLSPSLPGQSHEPDSALARDVVNGDFERGAPGAAPAGWQLESVPGELHYRARLQRGGPSLEQMVVLDRVSHPSPVGFGSLTQRIDARPLRGARVCVSARLRLTSHALGDKAFVFGMPETASTLPFASSVQASASDRWQRLSVEIEVPAGALTMQLGVVVTGAAIARIDDVQLQCLDP